MSSWRAPAAGLAGAVDGGVVSELDFASVESFDVGGFELSMSMSISSP